jgi:hypothetical protein
MWPNAKQPQVELWSLPHLPHAYPVGRRVVEPAQVDATAGIARFLGLD